MPFPRLLSLAAAASALLPLAFSSAFAAETERYSIYASGKKIGHLATSREGSAIEIDFLVSENGRGPRSQERLVLNEKGLPLHWRIDAAGLGGGKDLEELRYDQGKISWSSSAEKGSHEASRCSTCRRWPAPGPRSSTPAGRCRKAAAPPSCRPATCGWRSATR